MSQHLRQVLHHRPDDRYRPTHQDTSIAEGDWTPIDDFLLDAVVEFSPFATGPRGKLLAERGALAPVRMMGAPHPDHRHPSHQPWSGPLVPIYDHHPVSTDRTGVLVEFEADHRRHAEVEFAIRDLKHDMGISHFPTKSFGDNAAWLILNNIARILIRYHPTRTTN